MPSLDPILAAQRPNPMFRLAGLVHGRPDVLHLEFGEPNFPTPAHIVAAAERSLATERQGYGPGNGLPSLRALIAERVRRVNGFAPTSEQIVVTAGGTGALMVSLLALTQPGDEVLLPDPAWAGYDAMLATCRVRIGRYPLLSTQGWLPDLDALEAAISPRTRVLLVNSPSNPGGAVYPRVVVEEMLAVARRHDLWLLSDECYDEVVFEGEHISPAAIEEAQGMPDSQQRVLTVGTFSKTYAMTGWRIGWVVAPPSLASALGLIAGAQLNNLPTFVQRGAEAALTGPQEPAHAMRAEYQGRRDLAVDLARAEGVFEYVPHGAFYLLIDLARAAGRAHGGVPSVAFAEALAAERGIAVAPGAAFGARTEGYARVSLASDPETLHAGITGLLAFARTWTTEK